MKACVKLVCQEDGSATKRGDDWPDQTEPNERPKGLLVRLQLDLPTSALMHQREAVEGEVEIGVALVWLTLITKHLAHGASQTLLHRGIRLKLPGIHDAEVGGTQQRQD